MEIHAKPRDHQVFEFTYGWSFTYPIHWCHEEELDGYGMEQIFYPPNSNLTVRISVFHIELEGGVPAPVSLLREAYMQSIRTTFPHFREWKGGEGFILPSLDRICFECVNSDDGDTVYQAGAGVFVEGSYLSFNIFAQSKSQLDGILQHSFLIGRW